MRVFREDERMRVLHVNGMFQTMKEEGVDFANSEQVPGGLTGEAHASLIWKHERKIFELEFKHPHARGYVYTDMEVRQ